MVRFVGIEVEGWNEGRTHWTPNHVHKGAPPPGAIVPQLGPALTLEEVRYVLGW